jgi:5'-nucleotidase
LAVGYTRTTVPLILVTNDDGYRSEGIIALADALRPLGAVSVVAPLEEASAIGHALTLRRPLRLERIGEGVHGVDGTPTDCVNLAIHHVLGRLPDFVVSGVNKGFNIGDDVTYSGTVSGALEGALLGIPSVAVSLGPDSAHPGVWDFRYAVRAAAAVVRGLTERTMPARTLLNINVPPGVPKGIRTTVQAARNHITSVGERRDPKGRSYYWIEEGQYEWQPHDRSDYQAVHDGFISLTPLQPDLTAHEALRSTEELSLELAAGVT